MDPERLIKQIRHYQRGIEIGKETNKVSEVLHCLKRLSKLPISMNALEVTGVGRTVNSLSKLNGEIGERSSYLVVRWKKIVTDEIVNTRDTSESDSDYSGTPDDYGSDTEPEVTDEKENKSKLSPALSRKNCETKTSSMSHTESIKNVKKIRIKYDHRQSNHKDVDTRDLGHGSPLSRDISKKSSAQKYVSNNSSFTSDCNSTRNSDSESDLENNDVEYNSASDEEANNSDANNSDALDDDSDSDNGPSSEHEEYVPEEVTIKQELDDLMEYDQSHSPSVVKIKQEKDESSLSKKDKDHSAKHSNHKVNNETEKRTSHHRVKESEKHSSNHRGTNDPEKRHSIKNKSHHHHHKSDKDEKTHKRKSSPSGSHASKLSKSGSDHHKSHESSFKHEKRRNDDTKSSNSKNRHHEHKKSKSELQVVEKRRSPEVNEFNEEHYSVSSYDQIPGPSCSGINEAGDDFGAALLGISLKTVISPKRKVIPKSSGVCSSSASTSSYKSSTEIDLLSDNIQLDPLDIDISALSSGDDESYGYSMTPMHSSNSSSSSQNRRPKQPDDDDALISIMKTKNQKTKVFSGTKTRTYNKVVNLFELCIRTLQENIEALEYTGGVPYMVLKPVLERTTAEQLATFESFNEYIQEDSDELWEFHVKKDFRNAVRRGDESWRELYKRCEEEREEKLRSLTDNINLSIANSTPVRKTQLAYVDNYVKPPRNIARKQAASRVSNVPIKVQKRPSNEPQPSSASIQAVKERLAAKFSTPSPSRSPVQSSNSPLAIKKKPAPLMRKAMQLMKGSYRR